MYKFSKSTGGFYHTGVHQDIPEDAVDVSDGEHKMLIAGQSAGQRIIATAAGRPALTDKPLPAEVSREYMTGRLTRVARSILDSHAKGEFFTSIDEACSYVDGEFAETSKKFRILRDEMRKRLVFNISKLDDVMDLSVLQVLTDDLQNVVTTVETQNV